MRMFGTGDYTTADPAAVFAVLTVFRTRSTESGPWANEHEVSV
jgi:hypothetical protein